MPIFELYNVEPIPHVLTSVTWSIIDDAPQAAVVTRQEQTSIIVTTGCKQEKANDGNSDVSTNVCR